MRKKIKNTKGFTLIELLVSFSIFIILASMVGGIMMRFYGARRKIKATDELYNETRFVMERIVRNARVNTIDYEEYFLQSISPGIGEEISIDDKFADKITYGKTKCNLTTTGYGECLGAYDRRFYKLDLFERGTLTSGAGYFNTDEDNTGNFNTSFNEEDHAIKNSSLNKEDEDYFKNPKHHLQDELYLISGTGKEKVIIKRQLDEENEDIGRIYMGKMVLSDQYIFDKNLGYEEIEEDKTGDGFLDSWIPHKDFQETTGDLKFIPITPASIDISNLQFFISPLDDPRKAFSEDSTDIQIHPHITITLTAKITEKKAEGLPGKDPPEISLQTTISSRLYHQVRFQDVNKKGNY